MNSGLNSLNVYPSLGESLDNLAVNIPYLTFTWTRYENCSYLQETGGGFIKYMMMQ
jgi:hypothetical protein